MKSKKTIIILTLLLVAQGSNGHDLLSKPLLKSAETSIEFAYNSETSLDKIFSLSKEEIAERVHQESKDKERIAFIKHFITHSDSPNIAGFHENIQITPSLGLSPIMNQINSDIEYFRHFEIGTVITPEEDDGSHHGEGELISLYSVGARELASEKCDEYYKDNLIIYGEFGELIPYFFEDTDFSKMATVDYYPYLAPVLGISHADEEFVISFTLNFKCAFKPRAVPLY